jgi:hypothetical protein
MPERQMRRAVLVDISIAFDAIDEGYAAKAEVRIPRVWREPATEQH